MATLGEIIKNFRMSKNPKISMDSFSDLSGLSKSYISMLERNRDPRGNPIIPTIETIDKVAHAMRVSFEDIFEQLDKDTLVRVNSHSELRNMSNPYDRIDKGMSAPKMEYDFDYIYHPEELKEMQRLARQITKKIKLLNMDGLLYLDNQVEMMVKSNMFIRKENL